MQDAHRVDLSLLLSAFGATITDEPVAITKPVQPPVTASPPQDADSRVGCVEARPCLPRSWTALCGGLWFFLAPAALGAADRAKEPPAKPLVVATPGGTVQDAMAQAFFSPFTAQSSIGIHSVTWDGLLATLQDRVRTGSAGDQSLVLMDNASVLVACQQGLLLPMDPELVPGLIQNGRQRLDGDGISRCGLGAFRINLVLAWDRSRIDSAPGWSDFWDVARRPGKRGLLRSPRGTMEIALLADGVAPGDVYRTLDSAAGLDRAFRKLDQLKPYIVWWNTPDQAVHIIQSGDVLMTLAPNDAVAAADLAGHRSFDIQWRQSLSTILSWAIPGRPAAIGSDPSQADDRPGAARRLLGFMIAPAHQADFARRAPGVSLMQGALPPDQALPADSAATPQHRHDALREDDAFWAIHLDSIKARFDAWIGK